MDKLSSYFDNQLHEKEKKEFEEFLKKDLDAQKELKDLQKLEEILLKWKNYVNVPEELDHNIFRLTKIHSKIHTSKSWLYYAQVACIMFAFLFGLFLGNLLFENNALNVDKYYASNKSILNSNIYSYFYGDSNEK